MGTSTAGASARKMSRELKRSISPYRTYGPRITLALLVSSIFIAVGLPTKFTVCLSLVLLVWQLSKVKRKPRSHVLETKAAIRRWDQGALAERKTARILSSLGWFGHYKVLHDRKVPNSNANIDHIVIGRNGVTVVDTKSRQKNAWEFSGSTLLYDGGVVDTSISTWETDAVFKALKSSFKAKDIPLRSVWAVHGRYLPYQYWRVGKVSILPADQIRKWIRKGPKTLTRAERSQIATYLKKTFPPAG